MFMINSASSVVNPLLTIKLPVEKFDRFVELFNKYCIKEFPNVEFDREHHSVRLGYSYESALWALREMKEEFADDIKEEKFEFNQEPVDQLQAKVAQFYQNFQRSTKVELTNWLKENETYLDQDELLEVQKQMEQLDPKLEIALKDTLENFYNKSLEEMQKLAETVTVTKDFENLITLELITKHSGKLSDELLEIAIDAFKDLDFETFNPGRKELAPYTPPKREPTPDWETKSQVSFPSQHISGSPEAVLAWSIRKEGFLTEEHLQKMRDITLKGLDLFQRIKNEKGIQVPVINEQDSSEIIIQKLLENHSGFCLGEDHGEEDSKKFLIENMETLAKCGVQSLYIENLSAEITQGLFDECYREKEIPVALREMLALMDKHEDFTHYSITKLVEAATQAGIHVRCMENELARHASFVEYRRQGFRQNLEFGRKRVSMMNYVSSQIIQNDQHGKYVVLAGAGHVVEQFNTPGLAEILNCPSVGIGENVREMLDDKEQCTGAGFDVLLGFRPGSAGVQIY